MFTSKQCRKSPQIQKMLESDYFFKNYDKIQTALKTTRPIKHKFFKSQFDIKEGLANKNKEDDDDYDDDKQSEEIDKKNKLVKNIDCLLLKYSSKEKNTLRRYKKLKSDNNTFTSSYKLFRSKSSLLTENKNQFNALIEDYAQKNYQLPLNVIERNVFHSTPLLMTNSSDIALYYKGKININDNNNSDNNSNSRKNEYQKFSQEKGVKYLNNLSEYDDFTQEGIINKQRTYTTPFYKNYKLKTDQDKDKKKLIKNKVLFKKEILKSQNLVKSLSLTLREAEEETFKHNTINTNSYSSKTTYKGFNINQQKPQDPHNKIQLDNPIKSTDQYNNKHCHSNINTNQQNSSNGFLLTGKRNKKMTINTNFNQDTNKAKLKIIKSTSVNQLYKNSLLVRRPTNKVMNSSSSSSINENKKKTIDDVYNSTKALSLFNNPVLAQEITNYFHEHNIGVDHIKQKYKSSQLIDLISSTKDKVKSIDIKSKLYNTCFGSDHSKIKDNVDSIEKLEHRLNNFDYNICKCILSEKIID